MVAEGGESSYCSN